jgi:ribosomal protein S18 acetylase RimI-like enzyme
VTPVLRAWAIRRLAPGDGPELLRLLQSLDEESVRFFHPHAFDAGQVAGLLSEAEAGTVAAFGAFTSLEPMDLLGYVWLWGLGGEVPSLGICVGAPYRGLGLGRALMERAVAEARTLRKPKIHLSVVKANLPALALYESLGFRVTGDAPDDLAPSYSMELRLEAEC